MKKFRDISEETLFTFISFSRNFFPKMNFFFLQITSSKSTGKNVHTLAITVLEAFFVKQIYEFTLAMFTMVIDNGFVKLVVMPVHPNKVYKSIN